MLPAYEPARLAALAALAEGTGYDDFWLADERFFREVYACLTLCALRTHRIRLGPCVTDPYSRHPAPHGHGHRYPRRDLEPARRTRASAPA